MAETALSVPSVAVEPRIAALRRVAIVPAYNEAGSIAGVIDEIRGFDPELEIVVVDDGSTDSTPRVAAEAGAVVLRLPFNLGIGGAVQTGYLWARDRGYDAAVQIDGDGQHDPAYLAASRAAPRAPARARPQPRAATAAGSPSPASSSRRRARCA